MRPQCKQAIIWCNLQDVIRIASWSQSLLPGTFVLHWTRALGDLKLRLEGKPKGPEHCASQASIVIAKPIRAPLSCRAPGAAKLKHPPPPKVQCPTLSHPQPARHFFLFLCFATKPNCLIPSPTKRLRDKFVLQSKHPLARIIVLPVEHRATFKSLIELPQISRMAFGINPLRALHPMPCWDMKVTTRHYTSCICLPQYFINDRSFH